MKPGIKIQTHPKRPFTVQGHYLHTFCFITSPLLVQDLKLLTPPPSLKHTATTSPRALELLLSIHKTGLHPHAISLIVLDTLTIQEIRQRRLDLLSDVHQFLLFLLDLVHDALVKDWW